MSKKLTISVCVGVLALSAFALASNASAQWMVNGTNLTGAATLLVLVEEHEVGTLAAAGVTISCTEHLEILLPLLAAGDTGSSSGLMFNGCSSNEKCTVSKSIGTVPVSVTAVLGTKTAVNLTFKPKTKTVFATIAFAGGECALLGTQPVTGTAKVLAPTGQTEKVDQLIEPKVSAASNELKVGSSAAELKGSYLILVELHLPWSFL